MLKMLPEEMLLNALAKAETLREQLIAVAAAMRPPYPPEFWPTAMEMFLALVAMTSPLPRFA